MMPLVSLLINVSIAALLLAVIVYCKKLNYNIRVLQDSKGEMAKLFAEFDQSIERATQSVSELKEATRKSEHILREKLDTANMIADDLSFMIERGNKMADQLEGNLKSGRPSTSGAKPASPALPPVPSFKTEEKAKPAARASEPAERASTSARTTASIESVLEQMANRNNPAAKTADGKPNNRIRSKAEQELFDSLKSGR